MKPVAISNNHCTRRTEGCRLGAGAVRPGAAAAAVAAEVEEGERGSVVMGLLLVPPFTMGDSTLMGHPFTRAQW